MENRFNISLLPDEESEKVVGERLISEIEKTEKELGIKFLLAGRDFPLHSTVLEGKFERKEKDDSDLRERTFGIAKERASQSGLLETLRGQEVTFEYVLIDRGNILLTSVQIPEKILDAREQLATIYSGSNLKPLPMKNIQHISIGRINSLPKDGKKLGEYKKRMIALRHKISSDPLVVRMGTVYVGDALRLIEGEIN